MDSTCGVLVRPGDIREFGVVLQRLVSDVAQRSRLSAGAPARARALCDLTIQIPRIAKLLASLA